MAPAEAILADRPRPQRQLPPGSKKDPVGRGFQGAVPFRPRKKIKKKFADSIFRVTFAVYYYTITQVNKMKSFLKIALLLLSSIVFIPEASAARQGETTLRGSIIDASGVPAGFATAFLSRADGAIVCGATAGKDGRFELKAAAGTYTLTVSLVGYRDASQTVNLSGALVELPPVRLEEDTELLGEAVVQAVMPKTKLTGEGLQTNVRGSVLENVGSANDVLARTPGLIKGPNGLEVIGKGSPLVYINGRRMNDPSELDRLQSNEIQSEEVITNPGAQYDASVRCVVRIRTIRRQGDGFGFNLTVSDAQSLRRASFNDPAANLNLNYRTGGVDVFAGINYSKSNYFQVSDAEKETTGSPVFLDQATIDGGGMSRNLGGNAGINWQLADNHFLGGKVEWGRQLGLSSRTVITDKVSRDGVLVDNITTLTEDFIGDVAPYNVGTNVYYNGTVGDKLNIDFNADYFTTASTTVSRSEETGKMSYDTRVSTGSDSATACMPQNWYFPIPSGKDSSSWVLRRLSPAARTTTASPGSRYPPHRPV